MLGKPSFFQLTMSHWHRVPFSMTLCLPLVCLATGVFSFLSLLAASELLLRFEDPRGTQHPGSSVSTMVAVPKLLSLLHQAST